MDDVIVVGAGIAGLTAAHRLAAAGRQPRVLEAAPGPGGRMCTQPVGGGVMDRGAQFLSTGYEIIPDLLEATGLAGQASPVSGRTMLVAGGRSWRYDTARPVSLLTGRVLGIRDAVPAARALWTARRLAARPSNDPGSWRDLDAFNGQDWATSRFGADLTHRLLSPAVHGLFFYDLAAGSAALPAALAASAARRPVNFTLRGGLGQLTAALAAKLDAEYGTRVERVQRPSSPGGPVSVATSRGSRRAEAVIITTPAGPAARMLAEPTADEAAVLGRPYSRAVVAGLGLAEPLAGDELGGVYGVLIAPDSPSPLAAIAVYSRADPAATGEVLTVFFRQEAARRLMTAGDATVRAAAIEAVTPWLPGLAGRVTDSHVARWPEALPYVRSGHAAAVRRYRDRLPAPSPVVLAGDYLGFPWSDSAAFNGRWAAGRLPG